MAQLMHIACDPGPGVWVSEPLIINLPFPPSVNDMYFNLPKGIRGRKGRAKTKDYERWLENAGKYLNVQNPRKIKHRCEIRIDLDNSKQGDCDNRNKPILDLLVLHGVLEGDAKKYVKRVSIGWEPIRDCRVVITEGV